MTRVHTPVAAADLDRGYSQFIISVGVCLDVGTIGLRRAFVMQNLKSSVVRFINMSAI
jgi:hypothetical protein